MSNRNIQFINSFDSPKYVAIRIDLEVGRGQCGLDAVDYCLEMAIQEGLAAACYLVLQNGF
jgi:hypothetical protein